VSAEQAAASDANIGSGAVYIDTSALAKWYISEPGSEDFEQYIERVAPACISVLTKVEMRSLMARRGRQGQLDAETRGKILATFEGDIVAGHLELLPHSAEAFLAAESMLGAHPEVPLTTLDALHLGAMMSSGISRLATADKIMAQAAAKLGIECESFPSPR
jgi:predicted nucleic acid-binding protein